MIRSLLVFACDNSAAIEGIADLAANPTARLESTHTIDIEKFVPRSEIDERYLESPYYLAPTDKVGQEAFAVIRD